MKVLRIGICVLGVLALSACSNTWEGVKAIAQGPNPADPPITKTWHGIKQDTRENIKATKETVQDAQAWSHGEPSAFGDRFGPMPTAYLKKDQPLVLKPPSSMRSENGLVWNQLDSDTTVVAGDTVEGTQPQGMITPQPSSAWRTNSEFSNDNFPISLSKTAAPQPSHHQQPRAGRSVNYNEDVTVFPVDGDIAPYPMVHTSNAGGKVDATSDDFAQQVFFGYGSSRIGAPDRKAIQRLAANLLDASEDYNVSVVGHASKRVDHVRDPAQKKLINFAMAQKRATAVTHELNAAGVQPRQVTSISRGDEEPNPTPGNRTQEAADRRAEIYVDVMN
ncbi:MAG: OmpA family protein [Proteobacteria bacterium]|nr:OmpA family protein [Pseudomonadota bacterium]